MKLEDGERAPGPLNLFYSYSHEDEKLRQKLAKHLEILQREGLIAEWHDRKIGAGEEWKEAIDKNLEEARIVLLLVSASFVASSYCWNIEMKRALERHDRGEARVVPVIVRQCLWHGAPFGKLQALPKNARAVMSWANKDAAWTDVAQGIRQAVEDMRAGVRDSTTPRGTLAQGQDRPSPEMGSLSIQGIHAQDWPTGEQHQEDCEERGSILNDTYRWEVRVLKGGFTVQRSSTISAASDFDLQANLRLIHGSHLQYGFFFRKNVDAGYYFLINNMGNQVSYGVNLWLKSGQIKNLIPWTAARHAPQGGDNVNIVGRGSNIRLFLNSKLIGSINDSTSTTGQIGLAASLSEGQSATVEMSDFKLTWS